MPKRKCSPRVYRNLDEKVVPRRTEKAIQKSTDWSSRKDRSNCSGTIKIVQRRVVCCGMLTF